MIKGFRTASGSLYALNDYWHTARYKLSSKKEEPGAIDPLSNCLYIKPHIAAALFDDYSDNTLYKIRIGYTAAGRFGEFKNNVVLPPGTVPAIAVVNRADSTPVIGFMGAGVVIAPRLGYCPLEKSLLTRDGSRYKHIGQQIETLYEEDAAIDSVLAPYNLTREAVLAEAACQISPDGLDPTIFIVNRKPSKKRP